MDLELTDDQRAFAATTRRFLENEAPLSAVRELHARGGGHDPGYWRRGAELGWTAMLVPESAGGGRISDHGLLDLVLVAEEQGRLVSPGPLLSSNVVAEALARDGSGRHDDALAGLVSGETAAAWALDGGRGDWDPAGVRVTARPASDGWLLDGVAGPVTDAASADIFLVTARSEHGLVQLLVPAGTPGLQMRPRTSLDLVRPIADLTFSAVAVTASGQVGTGDATPEVHRQLRTALVLQAAEMAGALDRVVAMTLAYANDRVAFGRPLASYQALKHRFADLKLQLEAGLATAGAAARAVAEDSPRAEELVAVAASYLAAHAPLMVQDCVQLHGGIGVTWDHDLHLYLRRVTQDAVLYGAARHHRERLAAILGMPNG